MPDRHWATCTYIILLVIAAIVIYADSSRAPFQFDDIGYITKDSAVHMVDFNLESLKKAALEGRPANRPLPNISFAMNYYFGRLSPAGYHWVNIIIHSLCAIILFFFCRDTLALYSRGGESKHLNPGKVSVLDLDDKTVSLIAFFAAMLWVVHPVNSSAVVYIVQRMTSMAAMFYMLSMLLYIKGRLSQQTFGALSRHSIILFTGAIVSGIFALASKQNTATLPIFILLYEWIFFQNFKPVQLKHIKRIGLLAIIVFLAAGLYYLGGDPLERLFNGYAHRNFSLGQRVLTELRVIVYYISLCVFPGSKRLVLDHDYPLSQSLISPVSTIFSLTAIVMLIAVALYHPKNRTMLFFATFWFFGTLMIESSIVPIEIIYEHRNYLPFMMPCLLVAFYAYRLLYGYKLFFIGILVVASAVLGFEAYQRNAVWQDPVVFAWDGVDKAPNKFRPRYNLGLNLKDQGRMEEAKTALQKALTMKPNKPQPTEKKAVAYNTLGYVLMENNEPEKAIESYSMAIELKPDYRFAIINLAKVMLKQKKPLAAINHLESVLSKHPADAEINLTLGDAYTQINKLSKAAYHFKRALSSAPNHVKAHNSLGSVLAQQGQLDKAIAHFRQAIRIDPQFANAYSNLGNALAKSGRLKEAITSYEKALAINPDYQTARRNMHKVRQFMERR